MRLGPQLASALRQTLRSSAAPAARQLAPLSAAAAAEKANLAQLSHWSLRVLKTTAIGLAAAAVITPVGVVSAVIAAGSSSTDADVHTLEMFGSVPRTLRVLWWSLWAAWNYKALAAAFAAAAITDEDYQHQIAELHQKAARRLMRVCLVNGGVYVKAGQLAVSMHAVPPEYRRELEGLQDRCLPRPFPAIDRALRAELGAPAAELFAEFDPRATAAASLAQVHRARLHDGTPVAVKIQYPGLALRVAADLATLTGIATLAAWAFPASDWRWLFSELRAKLTAELDFRHEAANAARLAACFAGRGDVVVPALVPGKCTSKILTMEWVDGAKVSDVEELRRRGLSPRRVGVAMLDAAAEMMCVHGFVHGDQHAANIFVRATPARGHPLLRALMPWRRAAAPQLVYLDHGVYFELPTPMRLLYCQLWCAFVLNDAATARDVATQLGGERAGRALPEILRPRDWARLGPEERRRVQRRTGVSSMADLARLLSEAPRALLDCLRATAQARHTATALGATVADRLRVNATRALHGLQQEEATASGEGPEGGGRRSLAPGRRPRRRPRRKVVYVGVMRSRWRRWNLWLRIQAMRVAAWAAAAAGRGGDEPAVEAMVET